MPAKHAQNLQQVYAQVAQAYDQRNGQDIQIESMDSFLALLPSGGHILDVGAGNGRDSQYFAHKGFKVTMLDLSAEMLAVAQKNVPTAQIVQADMTEMEFVNDTFDGVWANASFLHLTKNELPGVLAKVIAFLKPGGVIHARVKQGEGESMVEDTKYNQPIQRFFSFYSPDEFKTYFEEAGFTILDMPTDKTLSSTWVGILAQKPN